MADLYNLSVSDGAEEWRKEEAEELSDLVQRRLHYLQVRVCSHRLYYLQVRVFSH